MLSKLKGSCPASPWMQAVAAALPQDRQVQAELQKLQKAADEGSRVQRAPPLQASQVQMDQHGRVLLPVPR